MSTQTHIVEEASVARPETKPLEEVLDAIRTDSKVQPQRYLEETEVPHGGE